MNIFAEHFYPINHNLVALPGSDISQIKNVYSHAQALSQSSIFIKKYNLNENESRHCWFSKVCFSSWNKSKAAIASKLSADIYNLKILQANIQDEKENVTRFLVMQNIFQPDLNNSNKYITSLLFKLK